MKVFILGCVTLCILWAAPTFAATNYALFALQAQTGAEGEYYTLVNGGTTIDVPASKGLVLAESGPWRMVEFLLRDLKPTNWTVIDAARWLSQCDGFLSFDFRMLAEYARAGTTIQGRAFDYSTVLDAVLQYEWWSSTGERFTGRRTDYLNHPDGFPNKLVRVVPMPKFLGVGE